MKVYIFGSNGFLGKNLVKKITLNSILCDNGFLKAPIAPGTLNIDITHDSQLIETMFKAEKNDFLVINLAAIHSIPYCNSNPKDAYFTNVYGNQMLYELASKYNCKKYIFASSGAVYKPQTHPHTENDFLESSDIYSATKIAAENILEIQSQASKTPVIALRLFNMVGPHDLTPHLLPDATDQLLLDGNSLYLGDLTTVRNYIHINDVVDAIISLIDSNFSEHFLSCNVCSDGGFTGFELVEVAQKILGTNKDIKIDNSRLRKSDRPVQVGSNAFLKSLINWEPKNNFEDAVSDYIGWRDA